MTTYPTAEELAKEIATAIFDRDRPIVDAKEKYLRWQMNSILPLLQPIYSRLEEAEKANAEFVSTLKKKLQKISAGQPDTWGLVSIFMELIDETSKEILNTPTE